MSYFLSLAVMKLLIPLLFVTYALYKRYFRPIEMHFRYSYNFAFKIKVRLNLSPVKVSHLARAML